MGATTNLILWLEMSNSFEIAKKSPNEKKVWRLIFIMTPPPWEKAGTSDETYYDFLGAGTYGGVLRVIFNVQLGI